MKKSFLLLSFFVLHNSSNCMYEPRSNLLFDRTKTNNLFLAVRNSLNLPKEKHFALCLNLLERKADPNGSKNFQTHVLSYIPNDCPELVDILIKAKADVDGKYNQIYADDTIRLAAPLAHAAQNKNFNIVYRLLMHGANIHLPIKSGSTALHFVVEHENFQLACTLILAGSSIYQENNLNQSPLDLAQDYDKKHPDKNPAFEQQLLEWHKESIINPKLVKFLPCFLTIPAPLIDIIRQYLVMYRH